MLAWAMLVPAELGAKPAAKQAAQVAMKPAAKQAVQLAAKPNPPEPTLPADRPADAATCNQYTAFCGKSKSCCTAYHSAQRHKDPQQKVDPSRRCSQQESEKISVAIRDHYEAAAKAFTDPNNVPASLQIQIARSWLQEPNYGMVIDHLLKVSDWPTPKGVDPKLLKQLQAELAAKAKGLSQETPRVQVQRGLLLVIQVLTQTKSDADKKQALAPALALCTQVAASLNGSKPKDRDDVLLDRHGVLRKQVNYSWGQDAKACPAIVSGQQAAGLSAAVPVATSQSPGKATRSPGLGNPEWPLMPSVSAAKAANGSDPKKDKEKDKQGPSATPVAAALSPTPGTTAGTPAVPPVTLAAASPKPVSLAPASSAPASPGHLSSDAAESPRPAQAGVALIAPSEDKAPRVSPPRPVARWKVAVVTIAGVAALGLGVGLGVGLGAPGQYFRSMSLSVQP